MKKIYKQPAVEVITLAFETPILTTSFDVEINDEELDAGSSFIKKRKGGNGWDNIWGS